MKFVIVIVSFITFLSPLAFACGPWLCLGESCMVYGRISLDDVSESLCAPQPVSHLDPQNWSEENLAVLALELSGTTKIDSAKAESAQCPSRNDRPDEPERDPIALFQSLNDATSGSTEPSPELLIIRKSLGTGDVEKEDLDALIKQFEALPDGHKQREAAEYLRALLSFYSRDYQNAIPRFGKLRQSKTPLIAEVALYTQARAHLLNAQSEWDGYSERKINTEEAKKSEALFAEYVRAYPSRGWTDSAQGLIRKARYLRGDIEGFFAEWNRALDHELDARPRSHTCLKRLFDEVVFIQPEKLLEMKSLHPVLWLVRSYYVTREYPLPDPLSSGPTPWKKTTVAAELAALEKDSASFKKYPDVLDWTRAVLLLHDKKFEQGYKLLQAQSVDKANGGSLSWVVLKARLLMGMGRFDEARTLVANYGRVAPKEPKEPGARSNIYEPDSHEGFFLMTYVWQKKAADIFLDDAPLKVDPGLILSYAQSGFTTAELRDLLRHPKLQPRLRQELEGVVLKKHLMVSDYDGFLEIWPEVKEARKAHAALAASAERIKKNSKDPVALYEIGRFLSLEEEPELYSPCEHQKLQPAKLASSIALYSESLRGFMANEKIKDPTEAKLLAAMIRCYRHSYSPPFCFFNENSVAEPGFEPKNLFKRLHRRFPNSEAARTTPYYW